LLMVAYSSSLTLVKEPIVVMYTSFSIFWAFSIWY
jgi:hypothetical protein